MENIDRLVEKIELMNSEITKMNFDFDGLKEENDELEKNRPFLVRTINQNNRKMNRLGNALNKKMIEKKVLDEEYGRYQLEQNTKKQEEEAKMVKDKKKLTKKKTSNKKEQ